MVIGQCLSYRIIAATKRCRSDRKCRPSRPIKPFLRAHKAEERVTTLLCRSRQFVGAQAMRASSSESAKMLGPSWHARIPQHRRLVSRASDQSSLANHGAQSRFSRRRIKIRQVINRCLGMVLHGLPEMFGRVVGRAIERNTFGDRIPIGKHARHGRSGAPAIQRMFPFPLYVKKSLSVSCGNWFFHVASAARNSSAVCVSRVSSGRSSTIETTGSPLPAVTGPA